MKRRIAIFTGTRADYDLLRPVALLLQQAPDVELLLLVGGGHFSAAHGATLQRIEEDGLPVAWRCPMLPREDTPAGVCAAMGQALADCGACLSALRPDVLLLLGDRWESLSAATAATLCQVPVAHIHGGEITEGAVDDALRHALTKMAQMHFTSCAAHCRRVIQMGEPPDTVHNVGSLGVENALTLPLADEAEVRRALDVGAAPYVLCTFHPATREPGKELGQLRALLDALEALPEHVAVFTAANADAGGAGINAALRTWVAARPQRARFFPSLGARLYLSAARFAACVAGNSSSGVLEIPSLETPVLDIGSRQRGRERSAAVLHCAAEREAILAALQHALTPEHRAAAAATPNPYQGRHVARTIADVLRTWPLQGIVCKSFHDIATGWDI